MPTKTEQRNIVLRHLTQLLHELYQLGDGRDGSKAWELHKARIAGFQEASRMLDLIAKEDVEKAIESAHLKVLGESMSSRRDRLDGVQAQAKRGDWEQFDSPAYERHAPKS